MNNSVLTAVPAAVSVQCLRCTIPHLYFIGKELHTRRPQLSNMAVAEDDPDYDPRLDGDDNDLRAAEDFVLESLYDNEGGGRRWWG